ncbi:trp operon leader peptide [Streptomyces roseolus]|uniref:trp operon leader peptide n=1 Tax=Streptomyces roseolus TaxID=67358 RepID=UPI00340C8DFA
MVLQEHRRLPQPLRPQGAGRRRLAVLQPDRLIRSSSTDGARATPSEAWNGPRSRVRLGYSARVYAPSNQNWWWTVPPAAH